MVTPEIHFYQITTDLLSHRVLESLKAGIRLPEARFANVLMASNRQPSVYGGTFKVGGNASELPIKKTVGDASDVK